MEILENKDQWLAEFQAGWLKEYEEAGTFNWKAYNLPRNKDVPGAAGIDLSQSKLMLVTSGGFYHPETQEPFDAEHDLGDYEIRVFPNTIGADDVAIAHTHYNHAAVNQDLDVLLPLTHLRDMVAAGQIGELSDIVSFMGYQPYASRVAEETAPAVVEVAKAQQIDAVLLVPS